MQSTIWPDSRFERDNFALLRLATAVFVIYAHAFPLTGNKSVALLGLGVSALRLKAFFAVSGFLVCLSWMRDPHVLRYAHRRIIRIVPPFVVCILITAYVFGPILSEMPVSDYFAADAFRAYHWNLAFWVKYQLPGVFEGNPYGNAPVNGAIWMMPMEVSLYLILPLAAVIGAAWRPWGLIVMATAIAYCVYLNISGVPPGARLYSLSVRQWVIFAPYFLCGLGLAILLENRKIPLFVGVAALVLMAFVEWPAGLAEPALVVLIPVAWISIGQTRAIFPHLVEKFGDVSYGTFLYGFIIQQGLVAFGVFPASALTNFLIATPLAILAGWVSWNCLEKPLMRFRPASRVAPRSRFQASDSGVPVVAAVRPETSAPAPE